MMYYAIYIAALASYAILPASALVYAFGYFQFASFLILSKEAGLFSETLHPFLLVPSKTLFELLTAFQEPVKLVCKHIQPKPSLLFSLMLIIVLLPSECLILTQLLAIYLMSLLSYQFSVLLLKKTPSLWENYTYFNPGEDHTTHLSPLEHMQMKLVTMISLSMVTFIPMSYCHAVGLFAVVSILYPTVGLLLSKTVNLIFQYLAKDGIEKRPLEAFIGAVSFILLLLNYKYEQYILHFLCILYCSFMLGQTASHFYNESPTGKIDSSNGLIELLYHPHLILSFWVLTLFYEVTPFLYVPRLLFIASATLLGAKDPIEPIFSGSESVNQGLRKILD